MLHISIILNIALILSFFCVFLIILKKYITENQRSTLQQNILKYDLDFFILIHILIFILTIGDFKLFLAFLFFFIIIYCLIVKREQKMGFDIIFLKYLISFSIACFQKGLLSGLTEYVIYTVAIYVLVIAYFCIINKDKENEKSALDNHIQEFVFLKYTCLLSSYSIPFIVFFKKNQLFFLCNLDQVTYNFFLLLTLFFCTY